MYEMYYLQSTSYTFRKSLIFLVISFSYGYRWFTRKFKDVLHTCALKTSLWWMNQENSSTTRVRFLNDIEGKRLILSIQKIWLYALSDQI